MVGKFEIKIDEKLTDLDVIEHCLNLVGSGFDPIFLLSIYALGKGMKFDDLSYYLNLINSELNKRKTIQ